MDDLTAQVHRERGESLEIKDVNRAAYGNSPSYRECQLVLVTSCLVAKVIRIL